MRTILEALDSKKDSDRIWARAQLVNLARRLDEMNAEQERTGSPDPDEPVALEPPKRAPRKLTRKIVIAPYSSPDDYREKTGKRFRKTTSQVGRRISREEAFAEFMEAEVSA